MKLSSKPSIFIESLRNPSKLEARIRQLEHLKGALQVMKGPLQCANVGWEWTGAGLLSNVVCSQALSSMVASLQRLFGALQPSCFWLERRAHAAARFLLL
ncbi:hypothetical protein TIFTF001_024851 [Ficus carica]|uniref:Uncharacterized protein n=1 Tax=Ficus carica TaxID=3494 RepID=A0AA88DF43_FICCA|nr:hypothetical protein TIFTF001_024851 [Ficus carica]